MVPRPVRSRLLAERRFAERDVQGAGDDQRRPGDPPRLVAEPTKLKTQLGWEPQYTNIEDTIATAWAWHKKFPNGYGN